MNIKRYPCGTPREMVSAFSRSALKKNCSFSLAKTDLFTDASSMLEVYNAVLLNSPAISRHIHFSGNCLYSSCMLNVKVGTPIKDIVSQLGGFSKTPSLIIINGELGGASAQSLDMPITKDIKSIKFVSSRKYTDEQVYSCINCGNCRYICPVKIAPDLLYNSVVTASSLSEEVENSTLICNSCGLCSTVCQARLPLAKTISLLKEYILNNQKEQVK
jgi:electron transport complex protein RnfC